MPKFYNVVSCKTIDTNTSTNKKIYHKVGVVKITSNNAWYLQLYHQPDTDFQIFPNNDNELPIINIEENHEA
ncbi:MAG: hypothetical protein GKR88_04235 [Flavobacteriaceae bacterium]|nr:MAG: hypothetical protein GKR88_04235 [Flavobacteriaceae bacterium]